MLNETYNEIASKHGITTAKKWQRLKTKVATKKGHTVKVIDGKPTIVKISKSQKKSYKKKSKKMLSQPRKITDKEIKKREKTARLNSIKYGDKISESTISVNSISDDEIIDLIEEIEILLLNKLSDKD